MKFSSASFEAPVSQAASADSEAAFRTYYNYVKNISAFLEHKYGSEPVARYSAIQAATNPLLGSIRSKLASDDAGVRRYLKRALTHLICLHNEAWGPDFFEEKNAWTPAQGWYAVHNILSGLACFVSPGNKPDHDRSCKIAGQLVAQRRLFPQPWACYVEVELQAGRPVILYKNFTHTPKQVSNLSEPSLNTFEDNLGKFLVTTLERRANHALASRRQQKVRRGRSRRNIGAAERNEVYVRAAPVTIFDGLYRLRITANYGNVDAFVDGCPSQDDALGFARALFVVVDSTIAALEAALVAYAGPGCHERVLTEAQSRNRGSPVIEARAEYYIR